MSNIHESYTEHVATLKALGPALSAAVAIRYEAPPGGPRSKSATEGKGVKNPTLDIVADPLRLGVSEEITAADIALRHATAQLRPHIEALRTAVARWEGHAD